MLRLTNYTIYGSTKENDHGKQGASAFHTKL